MISWWCLYSVRSCYQHNTVKSKTKRKNNTLTKGRSLKKSMFPQTLRSRDNTLGLTFVDRMTQNVSHVTEIVFITCSLSTLPSVFHKFFFFRMFLYFVLVPLFFKFSHPNEALLAIHRGLLFNTFGVFSIKTHPLQPIWQHKSGHIFLTLTQQH